MNEKQAHSLAVAMAKGIMGRDYREAAEPAEDELLPCPFCGGEASFHTIQHPYGWHSDGCEAVWVSCKNCRACSGTEFSRKSAAKVWNRRANNG